MDVAFIKDQREKIGTFGGKMMMDGIDIEEATKMQKSLAREEKRKSKVDAVEKNLEEKKKEANEKRVRVQEELVQIFDSEDKDNNDNTPLFEDMAKPSKTSVKRTTIDMGPFVAELTRFSCGDRAGAALWNRGAYFPWKFYVFWFTFFLITFCCIEMENKHPCSGMLLSSVLQKLDTLKRMSMIYLLMTTLKLIRIRYGEKRKSLD